MVSGQAMRIDSFNALASDMNAVAQSFISYCKSKNLSPETVDYYGYKLLAFTRFLEKNGPGIGPKNVTKGIVRAFITNEAQRNTTNTDLG